MSVRERKTTYIGEPKGFEFRTLEFNEEENLQFFYSGVRAKTKIE